MRAHVLSLGIGLGLLVVVLTRGAGPASSPAVPPPAVTPPSRAPAARAIAAPAAPVRNPFAYADEAREEADARRPAAALRAEPGPRSPESGPEVARVRLVGFVRQGEILKAALALFGSVTIVGAGEEVEGYAVLAVDEDEGVRLRGPDGVERTLVLPPS